ncbi:MAG: TonB family protein [Lentimicrobium sp.]|nr:TonB family protein [Lentimicrobium sp.]
MKKTYLITAIISMLCFILLSHDLKSQDVQDTMFYNEFYSEAIRGNHYYMQVKTMADDGYILRTYYANGQLKTEQIFKGEETPLLEGPTITYSEDGRIIGTNNFRKGSYEGEQKKYYDSGALYYVENYINWKQHGERIVYYEDGSLKRKESFEYDKLVYGNCYSMDGKDTTWFPFYEHPQFSGGEEQRIRYLVDNIKYPRKARRMNISGMVYLTFLVRKSGEVTDVEIVRGVHPLLDEEAMRVVKKMPPWKPGKQDGKPVNTRFNMPIKFTLAG